VSKNTGPILASDWKKPDGLFVIQPEEVDMFLLPLAVGRLPGVGKVTEEKLKSFDVYRCSLFLPASAKISVNADQT